MSRPLHPAFRFATEAQWQACLFAGADRSSTESRAGLRPFAPFCLPGTVFATQGADAPALTETAEVLWRDDTGRLQRLPYGDVHPHGSIAPGAIARAKRMLAIAGTLWVVGQGSLQAFDVDSLSRLLSVDLGGLSALDIAGDGRDGVYVLLGSNCRRWVGHVDCAGTLDTSRAVAEPDDAEELVYLGHPKKLVLLGSRRTKLYWFGLDDGPAKPVVLVSALRPCFDAITIGSDGCFRLFLVGTDGKAAGGGHQVLLIDAEGNALGTIPLGAKPSGIIAGRAQLFVATAAGLVRFDPTASVPRGGGGVTAAALTPPLRSPSRITQRWQRIEARVVLPPGCSLEISYGAAPDKADERGSIMARLDDQSVSPLRRLAAWQAELAQRTFVFHGDPALAPGEATVLSTPLHDVTDEWLWVHVAVSAAPGGSMPSLSELSVLYPGPTLIEHLPAIYRSAELESGDFLRALVGVLEAGTQQLDATIGDLGRRIHPATAQGEWLDFVAGWLGLPWDDGLSLDQKRRLAGSAAAIAGGYGTLAGLDALLGSLLPDRPRRFRIVDGTAEFGIATIGGGTCEGSKLPAMLSGLPRTATELGNKAILGLARLPCGEPEPETARLLGRIRIDIAAGAEERAAWSPWLQTLIDSMLPATARADLRWLGRNAFAEPDRLSDGLTLDSEPMARLGTDSVTGAARLGGRKRTTLPRRLGDDSTLN